MIGIRLVPLLLADGHTVAGMTRSERGIPALVAQGAEPVVCDAYDADGLRDAVVAFAPEMVMHQLTDLPSNPTDYAAFGAPNDRMRSEGTRNLLAAAAAAHAPRFLAQSIAWELPGERGAIIQRHEQSVLAVGGVVLRYGQFYGPGTYDEGDDPPPSDDPRVHVDTAARRTVELLDAPSGIVTVVD